MADTITTVPSSATNFWLYLGQIFVAIVTSGVTTAVVTSWLRRGEDARLHSQSKEIEAIKSLMRRIDDRSKTQFDWLHQRRAEAAVEIYGLIIDVELAITRLLQETTHGRSSEEDKAALFSNASSAGNAFRNQYSRKALLLPETVIRELKQFDDLIWEMFVTASVFGREQTAQDRVTMANRSDWGPIRDTIKKVRGSLRIALGDVVEEAKSSSRAGILGLD